ncbi:MAG: NAD(P)H-hydrate dehydratase [Burkholderiales bacterium]|nr:NAD(P)H-hydrate dehydratase [Burkholderiales bacterium]
MQRAGLAAAAEARALLAGAAGHPPRVLVLAGPGNNGGDAYEVATHLLRAGCAVHLVAPADPARLPADAAAARQAWHAAGGRAGDFPQALADVDLIVDGLFGIGLTRAIGPPYDAWIAAVNAARRPVLALDVPSGLDADTGYVHGCAVAATRTVTFIADKPGLHTHHGPDLAGTVTVAPLALRPQPAPGADCGHLLDRRAFAALLAPRARNTHKGTYGTVAVVGGAAGMAGAALLAGRAALLLGAGRVLAGLLAPGLAVDPAYPELMLREAGAVLDACPDAAVVGPGLGASDAAAGALARAIALPCALVLDADALNLIAADAGLAAAVSRRAGATLMTPHPLEAARLLGRDLAAVQRDRIAAALALARLYRAAVVVKGAGSVIASAEGAWWINPTGNPGMASAGMGDVLAGIAGALAARAAPLAALQCAVYLHGAAADALVADGIGPAGLTAGETIGRARALLNRWSAG